MSKFERFYRVKEVCEILRIDRRTLWKWIKEGKIRAIKLPSGRHRIPESEIRKILGESSERSS
ncbi:MAG: helix-turn-helix domain-containing protein [Candidatus Baldrarchaeia archaeon]